jgi:hypothetical protein
MVKRFIVEKSVKAKDHYHNTATAPNRRRRASKEGRQTI